MASNRNLIRFDWAIKRLLRNKSNFGVLEGFLSELLRQDIRVDMLAFQERTGLFPAFSGDRKERIEPTRF